MTYRLPASLLLVSALVLSTAGASAQSGDSAVAQALFDQAKQLMTHGHAAEACPKLEESQRLDPRSGTLINLASCYEQTARLASAWSTYIEAATASKASGNADRESVARQHAAALAPRVSKLTIVIAPELRGAAGLEVKRDGGVVREPEWGLALPSDAGDHEVTATAPGREPFQTRVHVAGEGAGRTVSVPNLALAPSEPTVPAARTPAAATAAPALPAIDAGAGAQHSPVVTHSAAIVLAGVGVVGVALGTAFGLASKSKRDDALKYCSGATCTDRRGVDASDQAQTDGNISTAMMIVGGVGLAAGITLWLTARKPTATAQVGLELGLGTVQLKGSF